MMASVIASAVSAFQSLTLTPNEAAKPFLDEDLLAFLEDPTVITSGEESLELIVDTGDFEINYSDAFIEAKG